MKIIIAIAATLAISSAHASSEVKFGDLNYFLKKGEFNILANLNSTYKKESVSGTTAETRGYIFETQFVYAFSDKLNGFVGLDHAWDLQTETEGNADFDGAGWANPAFGANYRFQQQDATKLNIDFGAVARVNIIDAERGSASGQKSEDGNYAEGRSSIELNSKIGKKWNESNEWQLAGGLVYHLDGDTKEKSVTSTETREQDSSADLFLRAGYQYRPVNEAMFLLTMQATRVGQVDSELNGANTESDAHIDLDFGFQAKFLVTHNVIASFNYRMSNNRDIDLETNGVNSTIERRRENSFGFGVDLLF